MHEQPVPQLGLEPCRFRRHDLTGVGDGDELVNRGRVHAERDFHFAGVDAALELAGTADTADEVHALVGARIGDAEDGVEHELISS